MICNPGTLEPWNPGTLWVPTPGFPPLGGTAAWVGWHGGSGRMARRLGSVRFCLQIKNLFCFQKTLRSRIHLRSVWGRSKDRFGIDPVSFWNRLRVDLGWSYPISDRYPWVSMDIHRCHRYPWISIHVHGMDVYPWRSMEIH